MKSEAKLAELMGRMRLLEADHAPEGWPAVQMRDITALCDEVMARSEAGALHLLARVRWALGDNGTRMQDELIAYCSELRDRLSIAPGPFLFEFTSFDHWADTAQAQFRKAEHSSTNTICLDSRGRTCWRGKDFMQARDENTFPVRVFSLIR